jgi:hypothetical protein
MNSVKFFFSNLNILNYYLIKWKITLIKINLHEEYLWSRLKVKVMPTIF